MDDDAPRRSSAVAALAEPTRRRLYDHVVRSGRTGEPGRGGRGHRRPARRRQPSTWTGSWTTGCSTSSSSGAPAAPGPGAGRPAKLYRRAECDVAVSLPERRYDLAGDLLAAALDEAAGVGGAAARALGPARPSPARRRARRGGARRGRRGRARGTSSCGCSRSRASNRGPTTTPWPGQLPVPHASPGAHRARLRHEPAAARRRAGRRAGGRRSWPRCSRRPAAAASDSGRLRSEPITAQDSLTPGRPRVSNANSSWF